MPFDVYAGLLSSIFGTEASAEVPETISSNSLIKNSQTLALLQADVTYAYILQDKSTKSEEDTSVDDPVNIVGETALYPTTNRISIPSEIDALDPLSDQISVYVVRKGDSISQVADMFDITVDTILSANDMKKGEKLKEGDVLLILPFSGVEHTVVKGETMQGIAKSYKVDVNMIAAANVDLNANSKLSIGEKIIIPGADMLAEKKIVSSKAKVSVGSSASYSSSQSIPGYFINPLPSGPRIRKTQGVHDKYAIDIGAPTGTPIYAAASGVVTLAKSGWNGGYGNVVFIKHPNGTETRYAHMSKLDTYSGAQVSQGEIVGYVGSTGRSTGPHLHYEVRGAKNNLNK